MKEQTIHVSKIPWDSNYLHSQISIYFLVENCRFIIHNLSLSKMILWIIPYYLRISA
jgi:hypothetical protein